MLSMPNYRNPHTKAAITRWEIRDFVHRTVEVVTAPDGRSTGLPPGHFASGGTVPPGTKISTKYEISAAFGGYSDVPDDAMLPLEQHTFDVPPDRVADVLAVIHGKGLSLADTFYTLAAELDPFFKGAVYEPGE